MKRDQENARRSSKTLADFGISANEPLPQGAKAVGGVRHEVTPESLAQALQNPALQGAWEAALANAPGAKPEKR